ncbi:MAG: DUF2304 domain-containing protein [Coriobacteriales bacterium]|jgi:hypothetical protein|nr:DUF2304 domain-containing protein [Coriobacteriales bacterium]
MAPSLRVLLILGSLLTLVFLIVQIRRKRLQIDYAVSWILISLLLLVASVFPHAAIGLSRMLGFESPANFVFLAVVFLLLMKLFSVTLKLSRANQQIVDLAQRLALAEKRLEGEEGGAGTDT